MNIEREWKAYEKRMLAVDLKRRLRDAREEAAFAGNVELFKACADVLDSISNLHRAMKEEELLPCESS